MSRDVRASERDVRARAEHDDLDAGFPDGLLSAVDRDGAAGDRAEAYADRRRARAARDRAADERDRAAHDRDRAAEDRARAAEDRDQATREAALAADEIAGLREALETRSVIGQAQGLLMERYRVGPDRAFAMLVHLSQTTHVKLREVAARLVRVGTENWHK